MADDPERKARPGKPSHMPAGSAFYEKVVPVLLIVLAAGTVIVVAIAAGVLLGLIHS